MSTEDDIDAAAATKARRTALREKYSAPQITRALRGLTMTEYADAFHVGAGWAEEDEDKLADRLTNFMERGVKTLSHQQAWMDGQTNPDKFPEDVLELRMEEMPEPPVMPAAEGVVYIPSEDIE